MKLITPLFQILIALRRLDFPRQLSFQSFFDFLTIPIFTYAEYGIDILLGDVLGLVGAVVLTVLIYKLIIRGITQVARRFLFSPNIYNGIKFVLRIILAVVITFEIVEFLLIDLPFAPIISGIVATAVTFASAKAINNYISGLWVNIINLFAVGDYVSIGGVEGVVQEISFNFTRIKTIRGNIALFSNINILDYEIINYTLSSSDYQVGIINLETTLRTLQKRLGSRKESAIETNIAQVKEELEIKQGKLAQIMQVEKAINRGRAETVTPYSKYVRPGKIVRYSFRLELLRTPTKNAKILKEVCQEWKTMFGIAPLWKVVGHTYFIIYQFIIFTPDPEDISNYKSEFIEDIYTHLFGDPHPRTVEPTQDPLR